jgi:hypothetical protein
VASGFRAGDRVEWNSEAGRVRGRILRKITSPIVFKGYRRHATREQPQYLITSEKTDHIAIHKGTALRRLRGGTAPSSRAHAPRRRPSRGVRVRRARRRAGGR